MEFVRHDHSFESQATTCAGWLYDPVGVADPPVVVMAHGFGGERTWRLPAFAERFARRGLAVFLFDYRSFGASAGMPRQVVDPFRHRDDWLAATRYARSLPSVDGDRLALWGTSFSGGHVVEAAARTDVAAAVVQVPFVDGLRTAASVVRTAGLGYLRDGLLAGVRDLARSATHQSPHYVPMAGRPGTFALLNTPDALASVERLVPDDEPWKNRCAGRAGLLAMAYRPLTRAVDVAAPVLVVEASEDDIVPPASVEALVRRLDDVERVRYPVGHFDVYFGDLFEQVVDREGEFLERHLGA
jgi:dienelactone hydrolase